MDPLAVASRFVLLGSLLVSIGAVLAIGGADGSWRRQLRSRLLLGVPWGTLLTIGIVISIYLFVQGGLTNWNNPVVVAFRAWSYFYPLGILTAGLTHAGPSHLIGNLLGTLVFGTIAEAAWSHFPTRRGQSSFSSLRTNPFARICVVPVIAVALAVLTGAFALGPVIGFSGVVFALAAVALVRYPFITLGALVASDVVSLAFNAVRFPLTYAGGSTQYVTPWWSNIAIQGHALGLFLGVVLAVALFRSRSELPAASRVWLAAVGYGVSQGLWALYLFQGGDNYVLFRAIGLGSVFLLAALIAIAVGASSRPLIPRFDITRDGAALTVLIVVLALLAGIAIPYNLLVVGDAAPDDGSIEVRDYTVFYGEDVPDQYVGAYDLPIYNASGVTTSGVIIASPQRQVWQTAIPAQQLASGGQRSVYVGGVGWREEITAERIEWDVAGNSSVYSIRLGNDTESTLAYVSGPSRATPTVDGRNLTFLSTREGFKFTVTRNGEQLDRSSIPATNASTTVGGLTIKNDDGTLIAVSGETRVPVAQWSGS